MEKTPINFGTDQSNMITVIEVKESYSGHFWTNSATLVIYPI